MPTLDSPHARLALAAATRRGRPDLTYAVIAQLDVLLGRDAARAPYSTLAALIALILSDLTSTHLEGDEPTEEACM